MLREIIPPDMKVQCIYVALIKDHDQGHLLEDLT